MGNATKESIWAQKTHCLLLWVSFIPLVYFPNLVVCLQFAHHYIWFHRKDLTNIYQFSTGFFMTKTTIIQKLFRYWNTTIYNIGPNTSPQHFNLTRIYSEWTIAVVWKLCTRQICTKFSEKKWLWKDTEREFIPLSKLSGYGLESTYTFSPYRKNPAKLYVYYHRNIW